MPRVETVLSILPTENESDCCSSTDVLIVVRVFGHTVSSSSISSTYSSIPKSSLFSIPSRGKNPTQNLTTLFRHFFRALFWGGTFQSIIK